MKWDIRQLACFQNLLIPLKLPGYIDVLIMEHKRYQVVLGR